MIRCSIRSSFAPGCNWGVSLWLLTALLLLPERVAAQNGARWSTNYYNVTGSSIGEIRRSMKRNRPANVELEALTEWNIQTRFGVTPFQGGQRVAGFTATTAIRITLPRWTPPEGVSVSVREAWDRYITALKAHEVGHGQFALTAAAEVHRRVQDIGTDPDAGGLKSRVHATVQQTIEEFKEREREYDRLTNHGVTQGVILALAGERKTERGSSGGSEEEAGQPALARE